MIEQPDTLSLRNTVVNNFVLSLLNLNLKRGKNNPIEIKSQ